LRDEYTIELLYRLNLLQRFTITPDVQVLFHPALNPGTDIVGVFGLQAWLVFNQAATVLVAFGLNLVGLAMPFGG